MTEKLPVSWRGSRKASRAASGVGSMTLCAVVRRFGLWPSDDPEEVSG